jgi:hypothetical protein
VLYTDIAVFIMGVLTIGICGYVLYHGSSHDWHLRVRSPCASLHAPPPFSDACLLSFRLIGSFNTWADWSSFPWIPSPPCTWA